jgi:hypothetical protein
VSEEEEGGKKDLAKSLKYFTKIHVQKISLQILEEFAIQDVQKFVSYNRELRKILLNVTKFLLRSQSLAQQ